MSEIAGKAEIPDQPEYAVVRPCSLMISCEERQCKNLTENEQSQLCPSNSHSCFHLTTTVLSGKKGSEAKAEMWDMSWLPSVTKWLCGSPASFLCLQTCFQVKLQLTVESFPFPIPWADSSSHHNSLDRSFCCSSASKWLLCFHNMPGHQGS